MAAAEPIVVVISEDPRASPRAGEALRIGLGIVAGDNAVTLVLVGPAAHLLDADTDGLVDGDDVARFRASLQALDVPVHVERGAIPPGPGWNAQGHPVVPVTAAEIAALVRRGRRVIVF